MSRASPRPRKRHWKRTARLFLPRGRPSWAGGQSTPDRVRQYSQSPSAVALGWRAQLGLSQARLESESERLRSCRSLWLRPPRLRDPPVGGGRLRPRRGCPARDGRDPDARHDADHLLLGWPTVPVWFTILTVYGLYNRDIKRISHPRSTTSPGSCT